MVERPCRQAKRYTVVPIPVGSLILAAGPRGVSNVVLTARRGRRAYTLARRRFPAARVDAGLLPALQRALRAYFAGRPAALRARIDLEGLTVFQRCVLAACARIARGRTETYGQLARRIGRPRAARAVGNALARNPVPILIPCHRVVSAAGSLGGFSAEQGVTLKRWLLARESMCPATDDASGSCRSRISHRGSRYPKAAIRDRGAAL